MGGLELKVVRFGRTALISKDVQPYSLENLLDKSVESRLQRGHADPLAEREVRDVSGRGVWMWIAGQMWL